MSANKIDKSILDDFSQESLFLVNDSLELLESIEESPSEVEQLMDFVEKVDRVMSQANSLSVTDPSHHTLRLLADYCAICKSVAMQGSQIRDNDQLYNVVVALLLDAIETVQLLLQNLDTPAEESKRKFSLMFLDRLKWISFQYDELARRRGGGGSAAALAQNEIDVLLRKLGI